MDDLNLQIIKGFGRKLKNYNKIKGMYLCNTDKGVKQVKKIEGTKDKILVEHTAKEILYNKGFKNIDRFCISNEGMPYYIFNNCIYTMCDYIDGVECDLNKNLKQSVEQLANMHKLAYGLNKCNAPLDLIEFYNKRMVEIVRLKKRITNSSSFSKLDILILKNYDYYLNQCKKAIHILENSNYRQLLENTNSKGTFCHNNYREENIIININGTYTVNFENCSCNIQMLDLAFIIRRYMKKEFCDEVEAYKILEMYNNIKPISNEEMKILLAMLVFPYKFSKICNKYFNRRRNWVQNSMLYSLETYLVNKQKNEKLLKMIENNII